MRLNTAVVSAAAALLAGSAHATIISGTVTGGQALTGGGIFVKLTPPFTESDPDNAIGQNTFEDLNVYGFDEEQNIVAPVVIQTDVGADVAVGEVVASHYIGFDPGPSRSVTAEITFDAPIFGVATSTGFLAASDFLANTGVSYLNPGLRGLEPGDSVMIKAGDPFTLVLNWRASDPGDYVRVFTQFSPTAEVPIPAAAWLFGAGIAGFAGLRRRKSVG